MGHQDANGLYYISDRIKQMIIRGGENIYSVQIVGLPQRASRIPADISIMKTPVLRKTESTTSPA